MSRQREDPSEVRTQGPLFDVPERHLSGGSDPQTSREAAEDMGVYIGPAQVLALEMVKRRPGCTTKELGQIAYDEARDRNPYTAADAGTWRQRIGRRLNELEKAGLIRREGERDGCCCWWPVDKEPR